MTGVQVSSEKSQLVDDLRRIYEGDAWHGDSLSQILSGISAKRAYAKPIPDAHSIWEIALHIAAWNETFTARLQGEVRPEPLDGDFPAINETDEKNWQETLKRVQTSQQRLIEAAKKIDEGALPKQFAQRDFSLRFFLHGIARHIVYHSGQIAILKKAS
jgi:uncharacterized damage-inducible protein DinB